MFERTLQDVVRGLRSQPTSEGRSQFASLVLQECRKEAKATDGAIKSQAVLKIAHLRMLGYDNQNTGDDDTSFHVIETMALPNFKYKRIGYLTAGQLLTSQSPVLLLATNSLKKELQANDVYIVGLALGSCSSFISKDMARDLLQDVISVTASSTKPYVRKRGTLCLYKMCLKFPEAINMGAFDSLRQRLDDSDSSVVSCAVNAICELAKVNPRNVLPLTPQLFALLTTSGNNWLTIKVVKLYASLLKIEPRLGKKLLDPLAHIVQTTPAKSLLYEGIATIIMALSVIPPHSVDKQKHEHICQLCAKKLQEFVQDPDQNLKYLGLNGFIELTNAATPAVANCLETKEIILCCLKDEDSTVRLKALELLSSLSTKQTVTGIVSRLLECLPTAQDKDAIVKCVILACVDDGYSRVPSCEWLLAVLLDLSRLGGGAHGPLLANQMIDLVLRVPSVREFASKACARLFLERHAQQVRSGEILRACAFICCEFDCGEISHEQIVRELLSGEDVEWLEADTGCAFALNAFKLAARHPGLSQVAVECAERWLSNSTTTTTGGEGMSFRVRDRLEYCLLREKTSSSLGQEGFEPFGPVHERAQRHVPKPPSALFADKRVKLAPTNHVASSTLSFRGKVKEVPKTFEPHAPHPFTPSTFVAPSAQNIKPFLLSSKPKRRPGRSDSSSSGEEALSPRALAKATQAPLWSTTLGDNSASTAPIVILASAPPPSFLGEDQVLTKKKKKGEMTLADVELALDLPGGGDDDNHHRADAEEEKPKKKKDSKKKKSTKKPAATAAAEEVPDLMGFL
ncbi:hypothetical protein BASA81_006576 [Batrachochytrium salamandrivorans]|nr:hypothetical protein BASA81_006576 [Batrachochytrium salamandrivorans]